MMTHRSQRIAQRYRTIRQGRRARFLDRLALNPLEDFVRLA
jgi:hypothetical protein